MTDPIRTVKNRFITGTALNFLATAFNQGSTVIINIIIARILMKEVFGEYAMIQSTLLTMATLGQLATGYTAAKYVAEFRSIAPQRAGKIMGLCALVSIVMAIISTIVLVVIAPWLATEVLKTPNFSVALIIGSGFTFFTVINGYQTGALSGLEAYGGLAKAGMISGVTAISTISFGAWMGGLNGAMVGLTISAFARCLIHNIWLRVENKAQGIKLHYWGSLSLEKVIISKFTLPAAIAGYYSMIVFWLINSFLVRQPGGYNEMALYSAATNLRLLVLFIPNVMNNVGLSILNNEKAKGDIANYHLMFRSNVTSIFLVSLGGAILVGIFGRPILQLFGKDFRSGYTVLCLLLVSTIFESLSIALFQYVQSKAKIWLSLVGINIPREAFLIVTAYYFVQSNGGVGLAAAYLGSTILGLIFHFSLVVMLYRKERTQLPSYLVL